MISKLNVLVVGAGGNTGYPLTTALLESSQFNVHILCRPTSQSKPRITTLKSNGASVHLGDIATNSVTELEDILKASHAEILICAVSGFVIDTQKKIFEAARNVGTVKRVVPSNFGLLVSEDVGLQSEKNKINAYIKSLNLPYTFIEVGWWMDLVLPHPSSAPAGSFLTQQSRTAGGTGDVKAAFTARVDIGRFVARIIADPRTLNQTVFCYGDEVTLNEVYDVANKVSGEDLKSTITFLSKEELEHQIQVAREAYAKERTHLTFVTRLLSEFLYSMFVRGENTVAKAQEHGALNARELYPDFKPLSIEEFAVSFYKELPDLVFGSLD